MKHVVSIAGTDPIAGPTAADCGYLRPWLLCRERHNGCRIAEHAGRAGIYGRDAGDDRIAD